MKVFRFLRLVVYDQTSLERLTAEGSGETSLDGTNNVLVHRNQVA